MKASNLKRCLFFAAKAGRPVMVWGSPGGGKSTIQRQFAIEYTGGKVFKIGAKEKAKIFEMTTTALEPIDLRGLCSIKNGRTVWNPPDFLPYEEGCVLIIEDLTNGHPQVLTALYSLILDGRLGDYVLPKGTIILANGNRESDKSYATKMPKALETRFIHLELDFDIEDWIDNAIRQRFHESVICFGRTFPRLISAFDPNSQEHAQPVPRTWEFVSDIMTAEPDADLVLDLVTGTVGKGAALEFVGFLEIFMSNELPDITATLKNPLSLKAMPTKPSIMYAFIGAMSKRVKDDTMGNFVTVAERMVKEGLSEFAVTMVGDAIRYNSELTKTTGYIRWTVAHQNLYK
jgi:hypothetical protein